MNEVQTFSPHEWPRSHKLCKLDRKKPRPKATPEQRDEMDRGLAVLGKLLDESGVWWQLEGAMIISVLKGDYIGVHADIDLAFLRRHIRALEKRLARHGYALFQYHCEEDENGVIGMRTLKRVDADGFRRQEDEEGRIWQLRIGAIYEDGRVRIDTDHPLPDVVILDDLPTGLLSEWRSFLFPSRWLAGRRVEFRGMELNVSNPARFIFWKSMFNRAYDENDLRELLALKIVTRQDLDEVQGILVFLLYMYLVEYGELVAAAIKRVRTLYDLL